MRKVLLVVAIIILIIPLTVEAATPTNKLSLLWVSPDLRHSLPIHWSYFDHHPALYKLSASPEQYKQLTAALRSKINVSDANSVKVHSDTTFNHDAFDLDIRQQLAANDTVGEGYAPDNLSNSPFQQQWFAGFRYATLKKDLASEYAAIPEPHNFTNIELNDTQFMGAGPRVGMGTSYQLSDSVGFITELSGSFLLGRSAAGANANGKSVQPIAGAEMRLVPAWDAKMGLSYSLPLKSSASHVSLEAGYQILQYVNALDSTTPNINNRGLSANNFNFEGPYIGFRLKL